MAGHGQPPNAHSAYNLPEELRYVRIDPTSSHIAPTTTSTKSMAFSQSVAPFYNMTFANTC
ncbi:hypothetical protein BGZ76_000739 [Entomortierella beljakovae]|nr:hypothetical protein BGZ76_000739 [Entomortierella beljakovae]